MRHKHHGFPARRPDTQQLVLHVDTGEFIQRTEGLVHQQYVRVERQRARNRHALLHAAGQFRRVFVLRAGQPDECQQFRGTQAAFSTGHAAISGREFHVLSCGQPRKQRALLKHHALASAWSGDHPVVHPRLS